jgi:fucose 4-O-acetylase-like acetyltransferase
MNTLSPYRHEPAALPEQQPQRQPGPLSPQSRPRPASPPAGGGKERDAFFDNAKYLAIVLVAMGHSWEPLKSGSRLVEALYLVVYTFHMPAFIIISGYFSRNFDLRPDRVKRLVTGVVVPYVLFETGYSLFKRVAGGDPGHPVSLIDPWYLTWFLCALFIWRLTTPIWRLVRRPLPIALLIAALATTSPGIGDDLDLQRVLQFLPFFVLGLTMRPEYFHIMRRRELRLLSVPIVLGAVAFSYWLAVNRVDSTWLYRRSSAQEMGAPWWVGPLMTLALFGASLVLTACFFSWVPRRRTWFTTLGAGTLYGYLLHGFAIKAASFGGWFETYGWLSTPVGEVAVTVIAGVLVTSLCTAPVRRVFRFAVEPGMEWAFRTPGPGATKPTAQPTTQSTTAAPANGVAAAVSPGTR